MTLTTLTINTVGYISYATLQEASEYIAVDPIKKPIWDNLADDDARASYLVQATRRLDTLNWTGEKTNGSLQENAWPRVGVKYPNGDDVDSSEVPFDVETACIILATSAVSDPTLLTVSTPRDQKRVKAGTAEVEYFAQGLSGSTSTANGTVNTLVKPFLEGFTAKSSSVGPKAFGTCEGGYFANGLGYFGVSEGLD